MNWYDSFFAILERAVLLHVASVMLEDVDAVAGDIDLVVGHVGLERLHQLTALRLYHLNRLLALQVGPRLGPLVRRLRRPDDLTLAQVVEYHGRRLAVHAHRGALPAADA